MLKAVKAFKKPMDWAKGKVDKAKGWAKGKVEAGKEKLSALDPRKRKRKDDEPQTPEEKEAKEAELTAGLTALDGVTAKYSGKGATLKEIKSAVAGVKRRFRVFKSIDVVPDGETWDYVYTASPPKTKDGPKQKGGTWKLAPGGLKAQEGRILEGKKKGKEVHLYTRHVDITEAELVERLEGQVEEYKTLIAGRIAAEDKKIVDAEADLLKLDAAPEPASKKERKVVEAVSKRGDDYLKATQTIKDARRRKNELERLDPNDREMMLKNLKGWRGGSTTADATKFRSSDALEHAVARAVEDSRKKIDAAFTGARRATHGDPGDAPEEHRHRLLAQRPQRGDPHPVDAEVDRRDHRRGGRHRE